MCSAWRMTVGCIVPENGYQVCRCRAVNWSPRGKRILAPPPNLSVKSKREGIEKREPKLEESFFTPMGVAEWHMTGPSSMSRFIDSGFQSGLCQSAFSPLFSPKSSCHYASTMACSYL